MTEELFEVNIREECSRYQNLINNYWAITEGGEFKCSVKELQEESGFKRHKILKITKGSWVSALKMRCVNCSEPLRINTRTELRKYIGRGYALPKNMRPFMCVRCKDKLASERRKKIEQEKKDKRNQVKNILSEDSIQSIKIEELSLKDVVYLLAVFRGGVSENLQIIQPLSTFEHPLTPGRLFDYEVGSHLYDQGFLGVHPETELRYMEVTNKGLKFYPVNVQWRPLFEKNGPEVGEVLIRIMQKVETYDWPEDWVNDAEGLWIEIAYHEALEYLVHVLAEYGIDYSPREKATYVLHHVLEDFAVAEICCIIWSQMKTTAGWLARTRAPRTNAINYLLKCIQSYGDRAKKEGWDVKKFHRNFECPVSLVAEILYDKVLQVDGFSEVPKI